MTYKCVKLGHKLSNILKNPPRYKLTNKSMSERTDDNKPDDQSKKKPKPKGTKLRTLRILIIEPSGRYCRMVWCAIGNGITHVLIGATVISVLFYTLNTNDIHASLFAFGKMQTIILDPGGEYWNILLCSIAIGLSQLFIGGILTAILIYCVHTNFEDIHVCLCTLGHHFFTAEAILSLNYANGWSTPMRLRHRRFAHIFLQMCAMTCVVIGTALVVTSKDLSGSVHGVTGLASVLLSCITFLIGPCALFKRRYLKLLHITFGIPTFIMSSISLCCGLTTSQFKSWASSTVTFILIGFIVFYTSFIMISCFIRCMMRL